MYQRIYNKQIHSPNGTLIDNWFEEEELRKRTGVNRTLVAKNFPRVYMDWDSGVTDPNPRNDTFKRLINQAHTCTYDTTYQTYGDHEFPEEKYKAKGPLERASDQQISETVEFNRTKTPFNAPKGLYDPTQLNVHKQQEIDCNSLGMRLMKSPNLLPIPEHMKDKTFQSEHGLNAKACTLPNEQFNQAFSHYPVPYYKDKPMTYWRHYQDRSNVYKSASNGFNSFGRSHAFTQPLQKTRGAAVFYQNVMVNKDAEFIEENSKLDSNFIDSCNKFYKESKETQDNSIEGCFEAKNEKMIELYLNNICQKIRLDLQVKGWLALRLLKIYLRSLSRNLSNFIEKTEFKFHTYRWGVTSLEDKEVDLIFKVFDHKGNNTINFIEFLNYLHILNNNNNKNMIHNFMQLFKKGNKYIYYSDIIKSLDMNMIPEVLRMEKENVKAENEFKYSWDNLKEDNLITPENFTEFFEDVCVCCRDDEEFYNCLKAINKDF